MMPKTLRECEMIILASLIAPKTAKAATAAIKRTKLEPLAMFSDAGTRESFSVYLQFGAEALGGYVCGLRIQDLATPYIEKFCARVAKDYELRLTQIDRPLAAFEKPGPDTSDEDCLFQGRWLRRGACGSIVSTSGVGKSSFSLQAATLWAAGQECLGIRPMHPMRIGIFQSEDDDYDIGDFRDRIRTGLMREFSIPEDTILAAENRVIMCGLDGSTGADFCEHIRRKQEANHFDLIIINPFLAFFGGDPNKGVEVTEFFRQHLMAVISNERTKCGCLIIHHTGKPNMEAMKQGDIFKAYLGVGSSEFTNCIRSALVITPWNGGKARGVFELIGAKHGDRLGWRDADGNPTIKKVICYANALQEHKADNALLWIEPDPAQLEEIAHNCAPKDNNGEKQKPIMQCAERLAEILRNCWGADKKPGNLRVNDNQRSWLIRQPKRTTGFSRSTHEAAWNLIAADPARFGLRTYGNGRGAFYVSADMPTTTAEPTPAAADDTGNMDLDEIITLGEF